MNRLSWIFIGSTLIIILAVSFFIASPLAKSCYKAYKDKKQAKQELIDAGKKKDFLTSMSKSDKLTSIFNIASSYIPETQNSSDLVIGLTAIASGSNLSVQQLSMENSTSSTQSKTATQDTDSSKPATTPAPTTTPAKDADKASEVKFTIKLAGSFPDFENFLKGIETGSRLITITAMVLAQGQDSFTAQLTGKAYYKKGTVLEKTLANIEIPQETIDRFLSLKTYGTPINLPTESGFGRTDPFAEY